MTLLNSLLQTSIYSAVVFGAVILLKSLFKKHASPVLLCALWFLLIARLLIPVTPDAGFHFITLPSAQAQAADAEWSVSSEESFSQAFRNQTANPADRAASAQSPAASAQTPAAGNPAFAPSFSSLLLSAWAAVAGFFLLRLLFQSLLLRRSLSSRSAPPPARIALLLEQIKTDMNVHFTVRSAILSGLGSPALSAGFRPVVMLPEQFLWKDDAQIEFALRHELMHLKRRDHLVSLLMAALRAIYWFNPVVWFAFSQMKSDMETACDCMVAERMEVPRKKEYAKTILSMYANPAEAGLVLGMGLAENRKEAERRIRAIFTRPHSGPKIKAVSVLLSCALAVACFTTACQPAFEQADASQPDPAPSVSVSPGLAPQPSAQPTPYEVPVPWEETETFGSLTVDIGTLVIVPEAPYSVLRVQPAAFTQDRLKELANYFAQSMGASSADTGEINLAIDSSPNTYTMQTIGLKDNAVDATVGWSVAGEGSLYSRFTFGTGSWALADDSIPNLPDDPRLANDDWRIPVDMAFQEQAQKKAEQVLSDLNITGLKLWGNGIGVLFAYRQKYDAFDGRQPNKGGFVFEYIRPVNNLYGYNLGGDSSSPLESEYMPAYPIETLTIFVTEEGNVEYFSWNCPLDIVATEQEDTALLPFGRIKEILLENIKSNWPPESLGENESVVVNVYSAQLMSVLVQSEDNVLQALTKPVWVFDTIENNKISKEELPAFYMTYLIDALTGLPIHMAGAQAGSAQAQAITQLTPAPARTEEPAVEYAQPPAPESAVEYDQE